ncbi:hypothetical protein CVT26_002917 [Gymnopilus dilepis]|uniref:Uncharacterized protein n=1 Tax=Gymnopilus dilepis TaxID=231916 RepID=A0A409W2F9_9AGAR|nr:hypothetical protein CVT26_002917 [Gymnopilus dilepis]
MSISTGSTTSGKGKVSTCTLALSSEISRLSFSFLQSNSPDALHTQGLGSSRSSVTSASHSDSNNNVMEGSSGSSDFNVDSSTDDQSDSDATECGDPPQSPKPSSLGLQTSFLSLGRPPPPRRKSGTLISLPADDKGISTDKPFTKTHSRTNTFGTPVADGAPSEDRKKARKGSNLRSEESAEGTEN